MRRAAGIALLTIVGLSFLGGMVWAGGWDAVLGIVLAAAMTGCLFAGLSLLEL